MLRLSSNNVAKDHDESDSSDESQYYPTLDLFYDFGLSLPLIQP
jgi:hypothetical protein